jgi:hypothetical protein
MDSYAKARGEGAKAVLFKTLCGSHAYSFLPIQRWTKIIKVLWMTKITKGWLAHCYW